MMDTRVRENINTMFGFIMSFAFNLEIIGDDKSKYSTLYVLPVVFSGQKAKFMIFWCFLLQRATKIQNQIFHCFYKTLCGAFCNKYKYSLHFINNIFLI